MRLPKSGIGLLDGLLRPISDTTEALSAPFSTPTLRLGVTGLSRAGKTVFITSLVHNLIKANRLARFEAVSQDRFVAAIIERQPNADLPRFPYERNIDGLLSDPAIWPDATDRMSQLRLSIKYQPSGLIKRTLNETALLNLDIIDYPGEWLLDLPLMDQSFEDWSASMLTVCDAEPRKSLAAGWLKLLGDSDLAERFDERKALALHEAYRNFLKAAKSDKCNLSLLQPGRFLRPGDLADSPALTFCPLPPQEEVKRGSLYAEMKQRYGLYKSKIIEPFFRDHFSRLDRQVVLLDLLAASAAGPASLEELRDAMTLVQNCVRPGNSGWLGRVLFGRKIDRIAYCATKADYLPSDQHDQLAKLTENLMFEPANTAGFKGADTGFFALASLRVTEEVEIEDNGEKLRCLKGVPIGEKKEEAFFPGVLPPDTAGLKQAGEGAFDLQAFEPPHDLGSDGLGLPHVRMDLVLEFLIGDRLL